MRILAYPLSVHVITFQTSPVAAASLGKAASADYFSKPNLILAAPHLVVVAGEEARSLVKRSSPVLFVLLE